MGFSNLGHKHFLKNINEYSKKQTNINIPIGINIGKNKNQKDALKDYEFLLKTFDKKSAYIVINISSPNTKGLRDLQNESFLKDIFNCIKKNKIQSNVFLKISPDMSKKDSLSLCKVAIKYKVSAIIISNTTIDYSLCKDALKNGGISGELLCKKSREVLKHIAKNIDYKKTILISCGGISNAKEVYKRIKLGASLVQIYTALIYEGVGVCKDINVNLAKLIKKDGFSNISQAIGMDI
jgi:dihydroorotate dehydrogenase